MVNFLFAKKNLCSGVSVNRPRYTVISTILIFYFLSFFLTSASSDVSRCESLKKHYKRGFLTLRERDDYCFSGCDFLNLSCERSKGSFNSLSFDLSKVTASVENLVTKVIMGEYDDIGDSMLKPEVNEATIDAWKALLGRTWGVFLCFVPVFLNQYKYYSYVNAAVLIVLFIALCMYDIMPRTVAFHNILVALLSTLHSSNSSSLVESVWTSILVLIPVFALFIIDPMWHLIMLGSVVLAFAAYIRWCFFIKHSGLNAGVIVAISQVFLVGEQMWFVKNDMGLMSLGGAAIEAVLGTIIPDGTSAMYVFNASENAVNVAKRVPFEISPVVAYLIAFVTQLGFFIFFRASLGAYYLHILRYKTDLRSLSAGFFVYSADFFGPLNCLFRLIFGYENANPRRVTYLIVGIVLMYFECHFAREFAAYRIILSLFDIAVLKSRYGRSAHYLSVNVDFMQAAFPHSGAPPWTSMDVLVRLAEYTSILTSKDKNGRTVRGLGVVLNSAGVTLLYSVKHVIEGSVLASFREFNYASPDFRKVTRRDDPLVAKKIEVDLDAPEMELLTKSEAFEVQQLVFINCSADDSKYVCFVPDFELRLGYLHAVVNLRKGDSGGPCFAVLGSGVIRLCGVVSRGTPRSGGSNIISFCYSSEEIGADSADEDSLGPVRQFDSVRRVKFSSERSEDARDEAVDSLREYLDVHASDFVKMKPWLDHFTWEDLTSNYESVVNRISDADFDRVFGLEKRTGDDGDEFDQPDGDQGRKKGGKNPKSRNKDKHYRKRQLMISALLGEKLKHIYSKQDAKTIFENIARGYIPPLSDREYIVSGNGDNWVVSDTKPDTLWS